MFGRGLINGCLNWHSYLIWQLMGIYILMSARNAINYKLHSNKVDFSHSLSFSFPFPQSRRGIYKVYIDNNHINTYTHTGLFGELALLYNMPRYVSLCMSLSRI